MYKILISQDVFEGLKDRLTSPDESWNSVVRRLLDGDNAHRDVPQPQESNAFAQRVMGVASKPHATPSYSPRQNRVYSYRVLGHEDNQPAHKGSQVEAYKHILQLICQAADSEFCHRLSQANFITQKCIAPSEIELCNGVQPHAVKPQPIDLNGQQWFVYTNCDLEKRIIYLIIACHAANLVWGEDVVLLGDAWSVHDKKGDPKERAERWARGEGLI